MYHKARKTGTKLFATAPMIDWSEMSKYLKENNSD